MDKSLLGKTSWAGYAAAVWAVAFAAISFYWAAGGTRGLGTLGGAVEERARAGDLWFTIIGGWLVGVLKVLGGVLALALALTRPRGRALPRRLLLLPAWLGGAGMMLYGGLGLILDALRVAGVIGLPEGADAMASRWHLLLWDPWWLLGGVLFALAAWHYQHRTDTRLL